MITLSRPAQEKLVEYLAQNNISSPLRVALMQGGCAGTTLGLALDEQQAGDLVTTMESLTVLIAEELSKECGPIVVDFVETGKKTGFTITSANPIPGAGGGCSSGSCGSSGCGC